MIRSILIFIQLFVLGLVACSPNRLEVDRINAGENELDITFLGHATLMFSYNDQVIHVDPVLRFTDFTQLPKADIILITHFHGDHLDSTAIARLTKQGTQIICPQDCADLLHTGTVLLNGDTVTVNDITIIAVPAYNVIHKRDTGEYYHPRGVGNGYVLTFGTQRVYIGGDTENIPEMANFGRIDIAFLPMNLPYTMTPEMVVEATKMIQPKILYPYHYGETDPKILVRLMNSALPQVEVRIRQLQ
ncbi:MAG: metal-dependent hydrolase [Candidatus Marinimicrobia bacterium CG_4_10_14_0_2_um_filter_48_9]|nr:MAG: metal-dependent hydrolase [Candidatus Marinimicrobia bacterium CG_4_10_14_0_2_um_filter_48_9]